MCEYTKNIQQHPWKINMAPEKWFCYPKIFASLCLMVVLCFDVNTNEDNVKGKDPGTTSWKLCSWKGKVDKLYTFRLIDAQILYMTYNIHTYYHLYVYIYIFICIFTYTHIDKCTYIYCIYMLIVTIYGMFIHMFVFAWLIPLLAFGMPGIFLWQMLMPLKQHTELVGNALWVYEIGCLSGGRSPHCGTCWRWS